MRNALRLAPRAQFVRPSTFSRTRTPIVAAQRYASVVPRPATDAKSASDAEQSQEDLANLGEDPNMVRHVHHPKQKEEHGGDAQMHCDGLRAF